ncbi:MAG: hypothetical protein CMM08_08320 [Rhodospirillaceae bacterium]|nr:hypothetical protein [Rhodospirillaceae bacterium]
MLLAAGLLTTLAAGAAAADKVRTRAWAHPGFGRLVFDWPAPVTFKAEIGEQKLVITFARPLETDLSRVDRYLGAYVRKGASTLAGNTVTLPLIGDFTLTSRSSGNTVVVDIKPSSGAVAPKSAAVDDGKQAPPKAGAKPPSPAAGGGPPVPVRVGEHSGFTRVVFDWTGDVRYRVDRQGAQVNIEFDRSNAVAIAPLARRLPARVTAVEASVAGGKSRVSLGIAADARLRHFRSGTKVVLDVLGKPGEAPPKEAPKVTVAQQADSTSPRRLTPAAKQGKAATAPKVSVEADKGTQGEKKGAKDGKAAGEDLKEQLVAAADGRKRKGKVKDLTLHFEQGAAGITRLRFESKTPVPFAVFQRAGHLWAVLDERFRVDMQEVPETAQGSVFLAEQVANPRATAFRFRLRPGLGPAVSRQGADWIVDLTPEAGGPATPIELRPQPAAEDGPHVFLSVLNVGSVVRIKDPEVGDEIQTVPIMAAGSGVDRRRDFVEFRLQPTAQGVAILAWADDVEVKTLRNGIAITTKAGMVISGVPSAQEKSAEEEEETAEETSDAADEETEEAQLFKYSEWLIDTKVPVRRMKRELQYQVSVTPAGQRNTPRWRLAKYFFARGLAAEALGVLSVIGEHAPRVAEGKDFKALRGAARYQLRQLEAAQDDLLDGKLDGDREVALWRGALLTELQEFERAHDQFSFAGQAVTRFPPKIQTQFRLRAAKAALRADDLQMANEQLVALAAQELGLEVAAEVDLVRGEGFEIVGEEEQALDTFETVIAAEFRPSRARAIFNQANMMLKRGDIDSTEAIDRFERLRFAWRGDNFEVGLLKRLGELYLQEGDYRNALTAMRSTVTNFPELRESRALTQQMNDIFRLLYLDGEADELEPVAALALYYDFRELTPVGKVGDEMIRKLSDRLVAVDLLDRASQLLEHQVKFRLKGPERARVGATLAVINLTNRKPQKALDVLTMSRWKLLPRNTATKRRHLRARALADLDRTREALEALINDRSREANLIRSDVYWHAEDWPRLVRAIQALLGERWKEEMPLTEDEIQWLLRMSVAMMLADDLQGIAQVRQRYQPKIVDTPHAESFEVLTSSIDPTSIEFRKAASAVAQIGTLEAFLERYRESMPESGTTTGPKITGG